MSFPIHSHQEQGGVPAQKDDSYSAPPTVDVDLLICGFCKASFSTANGLRNHKWEMSKNESMPGQVLKHIYCHICDRDFISTSAGRQHWIQYHAEKQNIRCPGCDAYFFQVSGIIKHIEFNECPKLTKESAVARCQKSLEFAKALSKLDAQRPELITVKGPKDFGTFLGGDPEPIDPVSWAPTETSPWSTQASGGWGTPGAEAPNEKDFPAMARHDRLCGHSKAPSPQTSNENYRPQDQQETNAWTPASAKTLFPEVAPAQTPTPEQLGRLRAQQNAAVERARADHTDPDHPDSPYFNKKEQWNPYTKKYSCPRDGCKKKFKNSAGLIEHLRSPAHAFGKIFTCPNCLGRFPALFALAAHCESASLKCHIRDSDLYERFLSQMTWNLVEVAGEHEKDGTLKYDISTSAKVEYGFEKDKRPTMGHAQVYGAGNVAKGAATGNNCSQPRLTVEALAKHQHQQQQQHQHQQQTNSAGRQFMQSTKPLRQETGGKRGGNMTLTAQALAKLNLQQSQEARRISSSQKQQPSAEKGGEDARGRGQGGWEHGNKAVIEEEDESAW